MPNSLGVTEQALENFFAIVEQQNVPLKELDAKLREIAEHYKTLLSNVRALSSDDPEVTRLRNEAEMALKAGEFARAEGLLNEASAKDVAAIQALEEQQIRLQTARKQRQLSAAKAKAANGDLKNTQLAYVEAAAYYRQAVELLPDDEPLTVARYLNEQGRALYRAGQYAAARPSLEKALAIREKVLGPDHPDTATSLNNLGYLLQAQGQLAEAQPYYARALAIWEKVLGPDHPNTATSLNNLGYLLQAQGKLAEAQPYYARALAIWEKVLGPDHPDTATSLNNLGASAPSAGDSWRRLSPISPAPWRFGRKCWGRSTLIPPEPQQSGLLQAQGQLAEAQPYYARALAIREKVLGPDHPDTARASTIWASAPGAGEAGGGSALFRPRPGDLGESAGPGAPYTALSLNNLGYLLRAQGTAGGGSALFRRALAIREKVLGPEHPDTATSLNNLGYLLQHRGSWRRLSPISPAPWRFGRKCWGRSIPIPPRASTIWLSCIERRGAMPRLSLSIGVF